MQIDQTDTAVQLGLIGGIYSAIYVTTNTDWHWLIKCGVFPFSFAGGFFFTAILIFLSISLLGRIFGQPQNKESATETTDETTTL